MNEDQYRVQLKMDFSLASRSTAPQLNHGNKEELKLQLAEDIVEVSKLQNKLFAENRQSLLIILQGMDSCGKDGAIKHIMRGINPQGVLVHSFKHPSLEELDHDFLWRHVKKLPKHGEIVIFNRSHYENVLISRVHPELVLAERLPHIRIENDIDTRFWKARYEQINGFEKNIVRNGTQVLKFFLHLSKEEQGRRFLDRIGNREKHWKFSSNDIIERSFWKDYQIAYEHALRFTSKDHAPWYVVPADDKWFTRTLIARIILRKLQSMAPAFPPADEKEEEYMRQSKIVLCKELGIH